MVAMWPRGHIAAMKNKALRMVGLVFLWLVTAFQVFVFARAGWMKFSDTSGWARAFAHWGYTPSFRIAIGVAEVVAAALLIYRRTAAYAAMLIIALMLGGIVTHIRANEVRHVGSEITPIVMSSVVLAARWRERLRAHAREDVVVGA